MFAVYLLVSYMCAKIRVWSCLVTDNSDIVTTLVYLLKLLYVNSCVVGGCMARNLFLFCPLYVFIHFSAAVFMAQCALDLARDHAP